MYGTKYYFKDSGLLFLALFPKVWTAFCTKKAVKHNRFFNSFGKMSKMQY